MSLAQLDRNDLTALEKKSILVPSRDEGVGRKPPTRFYTLDDALMALVLHRLRQKRLGRRNVQGLIRDLAEAGFGLDGAPSYLLTDGNSIRFARTSEQVIEVLRESQMPLALVPVQDLIETVEAFRRRRLRD